MLKRLTNDFHLPIKDIIGYGGIVLLQSSALPTLYGIIVGSVTLLPPLQMVILIWLGLLLFLIHAVWDKNKVYIISNGIGLTVNSIILLVLL